MIHKPELEPVFDLTAEQRRRFDEFSQKWIAICLSTERANKAEAEEGIATAYRMAGLDKPRVIWCSSPLAMAVSSTVASEILGIQFESVKATIRNASRGSVEKQVREIVAEPVWQELNSEICEQLIRAGNGFAGMIENTVGQRIEARVWSKLADNVRHAVSKAIEDVCPDIDYTNRKVSYKQFVQEAGSVFQDAYWLARYDFLAEVCHLNEAMTNLEGIRRLAMHAGWYIPQKTICWVCDRPEVFRVTQTLDVHCEDGAAISYADGFAVFAVKGVRMSRRIVENPESITLEQIQKEILPLARRTLIKRYGQQRYSNDMGAPQLTFDDQGDLCLTPDQIQRRAEFESKWISAGLKTTPGNRRDAESGIRKAYEVFGLPRPEIIWCDSPLSMMLAQFVVNSHKHSFFKHFRYDQPDVTMVSDHLSFPHNALKETQERLIDLVGENCWSSADKSIGNSVRDGMYGRIWDVNHTVRTNIRFLMWHRARHELAHCEAGELDENIRKSVERSVGCHVLNSTDVLSKILSGQWPLKLSMPQPFGQLYIPDLALCDFFAQVCGLQNYIQKLSGLWSAVLNCSYFLSYKDICYLCDLPTVIKVDDKGNLHCDDGPAIAFSDGWSLYALHGIEVTKQIVEEPWTMTIAQIEAEWNLELRRLMIERFGVSRYVIESGLEEIHRDEFGTLYRREGDFAGDEPVVMLKVINSTANADGSRKEFIVRVPPDMQSARQAVAWTFNLTEFDYEPLQES